MTWISEAEIVVVDTSVVVNFAKAGALNALADYLGERALITQDVYGELGDWASTYGAVGRLLDRSPWNEPMELSEDLTQKVLDILGFVGGQDPGTRLRDVGEVSSVVLAQSLRDAGRRHPILLLDDVAHGKNLARMRKLEVVDTPGLVREMVVNDALPRALGGKVWRETFSDRTRWAAYDSWIDGEP